MADGSLLDADEMLRPYEARPVATTEAEAERRRDGLKLGWELNRLQGGIECGVSRRLGELYSEGRVSDAEFLELAAKLARHGLLLEQSEGVDGR